jgi:hypothetical protein
VDQGIVSEDLDSDPESPQYQATSWLAADPDYYSYREGRVIQRWTLAVMAYSMDASSTEGRDRMNRGLMDEWLEYSDECAWFSSGTIASCDDAGNFVRLDIQDLNLGGTLPAEISLLSNSLRKCFWFQILCSRVLLVKQDAHIMSSPLYLPCRSHYSRW